MPGRFEVWLNVPTYAVNGRIPVYYMIGETVSETADEEFKSELTQHGLAMVKGSPLQPVPDGDAYGVWRSNFMDWKNKFVRFYVGLIPTTIPGHIVVAAEGCMNDDVEGMEILNREETTANMDKLVLGFVRSLAF